MKCKPPRTARLTDAITLQRGFDLPEGQRQAGTIPVVASTGVVGYHSEKRVDGPGVVIGRSGSIGGGQYIAEDFWPLNTTLWVKDFKAHDPRFIYYLLRNIDFTPFNAGVGVPTLNRNHLDSLIVASFDRETESTIASILSAYDDLIENNNRRIALLEQAARLLYEEWFVRLRFPGREHTKIVDGVPKGWRWTTAADLCDCVRRGIAPHYDDDAEGLVINQKCIRDGRLNLGLARHQSRAFQPDRQVQAGDVLVNSTGEGTLGRIAQVKAPVAACTVDTHVTIVRPRCGDVGIHYFGMVMLSHEPLLATLGRGATNQTELSPTSIGSMKVLLPTRALADEYEAFAAPIYMQIQNLTAQNEKARAARDLLLPRLMSGELMV